MKTIVLTVLSIMGLGAAASAQDAFRFDPPPVVALEGEERIDLASASDQEPISLPRSLASTPVERADEYSAFSLGIAGGYLNQKDADKGTWFGGVQARLRMGIFAVEGSIQFHQNKYQGGDVVVTQYPVQVTAFLYFIPTGPIRPYILGGVGWYYTRVDYKGVLSGISDDTQHIFGSTWAPAPSSSSAPACPSTPTCATSS